MVLVKLSEAFVKAFPLIGRLLLTDNWSPEFYLDFRNGIAHQRTFQSANGFYRKLGTPAPIPQEIVRPATETLRLLGHADKRTITRITPSVTQIIDITRSFVWDK